MYIRLLELYLLLFLLLSVRVVVDTLSSSNDASAWFENGTDSGCFSRYPRSQVGQWAGLATMD